MKIGDIVKIADRDGEWEVEIVEIRKSLTYGPSIRGKYLDNDDSIYGLWPFVNIYKIEIIKPAYNDGDVVQSNFCTFERIGGKWYIQTSFTDDNIEDAKKNTPIHPYAINIFNDAGSKETAKKIEETLENRPTVQQVKDENRNFSKTIEHDGDGDWCGR